MVALIAMLTMFQVPALAGEWNVGTIDQRGRNFTVEGRSWMGAGTIRADGLVHVAWTNGGRLAHGVYVLSGGELIGHWGWAEDVEITPEGDICGGIHDETIRRE